MSYHHKYWLDVQIQIKSNLDSKRMAEKRSGGVTYCEEAFRNEAGIETVWDQRYHEKVF